ncbi:MAG: hypothetical protein Kow0069_27350 [Promethearchaeota archaeon]
MRVARTTLYTSRKPRHHELDGVHYHFRSREEIEKLPSPRFVVFSVHEHLQALDLQDVVAKLQDHDAVFVEVFHTAIEKLNEWAEKYKHEHDLEVISIFLLPASVDEVEAISAHLGVEPREVLYRLVAGKMRRRGEDDEEEIEREARDAWAEVQSAPHYDHRIVCPHGEDEVDAWTGKHLEDLHPHVQLVVEQFHAFFSRHPGRKKLVVLSGPSCTGKGPLWATYSRLYL